MSDAWIGYALAAVGPFGTFLIGLLMWRVSRRSQNATERNLAHAQDDAAFGRMKSLFDIVDKKFVAATERLDALEEERIENRRQADQDRRERDELASAVDTLRTKVQRLEGRLIRAVEYIRDLLAWARAVSASTPHPAVPDDIADLIEPDPGK